MKSLSGNLQVAVFLSLGLQVYAGITYRFNQRICGSKYPVTGATSVTLLYTEPIAALNECKVIFYRDVNSFKFNRLCFNLRRFLLQACEVHLLLYDGKAYPSKTYNCDDLGRYQEPYCTTGSSLIVSIRDLDMTNTYKTRNIQMEFYLVNSSSNFRPEATDAPIKADAGFHHSIIMTAAIAGTCAFLVLFLIIGIAVACRRRRTLQRSSQGYSSPSAAGEAVTYAEQPQLDGYQLQPGSWSQTGNTSHTEHQQATEYQPQAWHPPGHQQGTGNHPLPSSGGGITPSAPPPDFDDPPPPYPGI